MWLLLNKGLAAVSYTHLGHGVKLHNLLYSDEDLQWKYSQGETLQSIYDVDYQYYITQCVKVIEQLKPCLLYTSRCV